MNFDDYVRARYRQLVGFAFTLTLDHSEAEDLVQSALVKCFPRWREVRSADAYVRRCIVRDVWRRGQRDGRESYSEPTKEQIDPADLAANRDLAVRLLRSLPARQRAVVVLRYMEDLSEREVAALLNVRPGTIKSQASRALATLKAALAEADSEAVHDG